MILFENNESVENIITCGIRPILLRLRTTNPFIFASLLIMSLAILFIFGEKIGEGFGKFIYHLTN